jgi:ribonuclease-3
LVQAPDRLRALRAFARRAGLGRARTATLGLLDAALTHDSFVFEQPQAARAAQGVSERLEFLGDAVLDLIVASQLYETFPREAEGRLSRRRAALVSGNALAQTAARLNLAPCLRLGKGEAAAHGEQRPSILAATFEALIGAVYLGEGFAAAKRFVERWHLPCAADAAASDPKTALQEYAQARFKSAPVYALAAESGPAHSKTFSVVVSLRGKPLGKGSGSSKKQAQSAAAGAALARLRR